jgi:ADP-ribosyl-[dinitrogen reductase] hydrolase
MLLRIAEGDAYGLACEYIKLPKDIDVLDHALAFEGYGHHPVHALDEGQYSDDAQMSIAVAETLLASEDPSPLMFADAFVRDYQRDRRAGYAKGFQEFLECVNSGDEFMAQIKPESDRNGAAMRSVPIGVLPEPRQVIKVATLQARLTHNTPGGITSSVAVALMSHFALYEEADLSELPDWLARVYPAATMGPWSCMPVEGGELGMKTATAVLAAVSQQKSLLDVAKVIITWGGDTDTVLAIAWGIASARMREPLPAFFDRDLERGAYGRDFLEALGRRLMAKYHS